MGRWDPRWAARGASTRAPERCERGLGFPALVQGVSRGAASPCPRDQSQERQGAAADSPTNFRAEDNQAADGGSAGPAAVPGKLGVCGRLPGRGRGPVGVPPLCRCVLLLAQGGRLCGLARPLARRPSDGRRTHPSVHRRDSTSGRAGGAGGVCGGA